MARSAVVDLLEQSERVMSQIERDVCDVELGSGYRGQIIGCSLMFVVLTPTLLSPRCALKSVNNRVLVTFKIPSNEMR